jgi:ATP-dependent Clp protease ATP-binding subunit ClpA
MLFTSSIGAQFILNESQNLSSTSTNYNGKLSQTIKDHVMKEIRVFLKEFLNRFDDIVFFQPHFE